MKIINAIKKAKTDKDFFEACNLIKNKEIRKKVENAVWYAMTTEKTKEVAIEIYKLQLKIQKNESK